MRRFARARHLLALALIAFALVIAIGLLQPFGVFAPADLFAIKVVGYLRHLHGAGLVTALSQLLDHIGVASARIWIALVVALFLARAGRSGATAWLFVTVAAMGPINALIKLVFDAPRPDVIAHIVEASGKSFPSGHAAGAMTLYGAILMLLPSRLAALGCGAMILGTGASRVWLGVHWPTDVIGGWVEGLGWLAIMAIFLPRDKAAS